MGPFQDIILAHSGCGKREDLELCGLFLIYCARRLMRDTPISPTSLKLRNFVLIWGFAASGTASLVYEVVWQRALTNTIGSSIYTTSIIFAAFMAGLALGAHWGGTKLAVKKDQVRAFSGLQLATGAFGIITFYVINRLQVIYGTVFKLLGHNFQLFTMAQLVLVFLVMLAPTTMMGAAFPVVTKGWSLRVKEIGRTAGDVYSMNTWGSVIGALAAGFIFVPLVGLRWTNLGAALINLFFGVFGFYVSRISEPYPGSETVKEEPRPRALRDAGD